MMCMQNNFKYPNQKDARIFSVLSISQVCHAMKYVTSGYKESVPKWIMKHTNMLKPQTTDVKVNSTPDPP